MFKKILISAVSVLVIGFAVYMCLHSAGIIELKFDATKEDISHEISINDLMSKLEVNSDFFIEDYSQNNLLNIMYDELGLVGTEILGVTTYKLKNEGYDFKEYYVYSGIFTSSPAKYYLIPVVDGEKIGRAHV